MKQALLKIDSLCTHFNQDGQTIEAVNNVSLTIQRGETLALVGESGSGKSVTAHSILQLLPYPKAQHPHGSIEFDGQNIMAMDEKSLRAMRGNRISMIFQEPLTALNPLHKVGQQIAEVVKLHQVLSNKQIQQRVIELLDLVKIPDPQYKANAYPHELSGGQRQRVMIAMAIACEPKLLICDEPTTALDVTIQKQRIEVPKDSICFTYCQVPILYSKSDVESVEVVFNNDEKISFKNLSLNKEISNQLFNRTNEVNHIKVSVIK